MSDVSDTLKYASSSAKNKADEAIENVRYGAVKAADQASDTFRSKGSQAMEAGMGALDHVRDASSSPGRRAEEFDRTPTSFRNLAGSGCRVPFRDDVLPPPLTRA